MLEAAEKAGIKTIIATPHSHEKLFCTDRLNENYQEVLYRLHEYDINLKLGFEVFMDPSAPLTVNELKRLTIEGTRYLVVEFPFNCLPERGLEVLLASQLGETTPIIAHPERNRNFLKDNKIISEYIKAGCMIQVDAASITGIYGRNTRDYVKELIRCNMVAFVASNAHYAEDYENWFQPAFRQVSKWVGEENARKLFERNAENILNCELRPLAV